MDLDGRAREKDAGLWDEMLLWLPNISYKDHVTNEDVHRKLQAATGKYEELMMLVKKWKLRWFAASQGLLA